MIFTKLKRYILRHITADTDPWAQTEAEYEEQCRLSPEIGSKARLASARHAIATGIDARVVAAAFPAQVSKVIASEKKTHD